MIQQSTQSTSRSFIAGLGFALSEDVYSRDAVDGLVATLVHDADPRLVDARDWTADVVSQEDAEAGTSTDAKKWTPQRVAQAIAALAGGGGIDPVTVDGSGIMTFPTTGNVTIGSGSTRARLSRSTAGSGTLVAFGYANIASMGTHGICITNSRQFSFCSDPNTLSGNNTGIAEDSAGVVRISDGGSGRGSLVADLVSLGEYTTGTLPTPTSGFPLATVTNGTKDVPLVQWDSTAWRYVIDGGLV